MLGNGDGTFKVTVSYDGGTTARSVAAADLNGDGVPDLAVASFGEDKASVLLGNGDGTFRARVTYDCGIAPWSVITADLDGDGSIDLISAASTDDKTNVLLGNGDGTFKAMVAYDGGNGAFAVSAADLNGDGALDLVTASQNDDSANVLLGNPIQRMSANIRSIAGITTATRSGALSAQATIDTHLQTVNTVAGQIGSSQSRLNTATRTLLSARDNSIEAAGRIRDADVAQESANLVRHQILQQTASGVLAQANQQPRIAIQLLGVI